MGLILDYRNSSKFHFFSVPERWIMRRHEVCASEQRARVCVLSLGVLQGAQSRHEDREERGHSHACRRRNDCLAFSIGTDILLDSAGGEDGEDISCCAATPSVKVKIGPSTVLKGPLLP